MWNEGAKTFHAYQTLYLTSYKRRCSVTHFSLPLFCSLPSSSAVSLSGLSLSSLVTLFVVSGHSLWLLSLVAFTLILSLVFSCHSRCCLSSWLVGLLEKPLPKVTEMYFSLPCPCYPLDSLWLGKIWSTLASILATVHSVIMLLGHGWLCK